MKERTHTQQAAMLGGQIKNMASGTSRSSKVNDRERRTVKHSEKQRWTSDVKAGKYNSAVIGKEVR